MMELEQFKRHMNRLFGYYGKGITEVAAQEWRRELSRVTDAACHDAVTQTITHQKTCPTLGEFKRKCMSLMPRAASFASPEQSALRLTRAELDFVAEAARITGAWMEWQSRKIKGRAPASEDALLRGFEHYISELRGYAIKHGMVSRINWQEFNGICGFRVPAAWCVQGSRTNANSGYIREPEEG